MKRSKRKLYTIWGGILLVFCATVYCFWAWHYTAAYREKLWLHRCNSLEKLAEQSDRFANVEVDIIIRPDGLLDVTHDADTTFGLSIDPYFAHIGQHHTRLWLDIKNVNADNVEKLRQHLDTLCRMYGVKQEQLIVESRDATALSHLTAAGYYTSYYVDFDKPSHLSRKEIDCCIRQLQSIAKSGKVRALSFPGWWYDEIHQQLGVPIDLLTWKHRSTEAEMRLWPGNFALLRDPQVKVILIKSKGKYHR